MPLVTPSRPDALRPALPDALEAWAVRVREDRAQVQRLREIEDPADFYGPVAETFRFDPRRTDDAVVDALLAHTRPTDVWLDIGAGGGRYALPLALAMREVVAIDPSPSMLSVLRSAMVESGIGNVRIIEGRWPAIDAPTADVGLMAHIGYDIEAIGPFLDAVEAASARLCVAVVGEGAMTTVATVCWAPVHGEPRVPLPALPELITLLLCRDRLPEVRLVDRVPPAYPTRDELVAVARRQLWLRPGSAKDDRLARLLDERATERDGRWALDWRPTRIGVVSWAPGDAP